MRPISALALSVLIAVPALATQTDTDEAVEGKLPCAQLAGQPVSGCPFKLQQSDDGSLTLRIWLPDLTERLLYFTDGKPSGTDAIDPISSEERDGTLLIYVGPTELFEVPVDLVATAPPPA